MRPAPITADQVAKLNLSFYKKRLVTMPWHRTDSVSVEPAEVAQLINRGSDRVRVRMLDDIPVANPDQMAALMTLTEKGPPVSGTPAIACRLHELASAGFSVVGMNGYLAYLALSQASQDRFELKYMGFPVGSIGAADLKEGSLGEVESRRQRLDQSGANMAQEPAQALLTLYDLSKELDGDPIADLSAIHESSFYSSLAPSTHPVREGLKASLVNSAIRLLAATRSLEAGGQREWLALVAADMGKTTFEERVGLAAGFGLLGRAPGKEAASMLAAARDLAEFAPPKEIYLRRQPDEVGLGQWTLQEAGTAVAAYMALGSQAPRAAQIAQQRGAYLPETLQQLAYRPEQSDLEAVLNSFQQDFVGLPPERAVALACSLQVSHPAASPEQQRQDAVSLGLMSQAGLRAEPEFIRATMQSYRDLLSRGKSRQESVELLSSLTSRLEASRTSAGQASSALNEAILLGVKAPAGPAIVESPAEVMVGGIIIKKKRR